MRQVTYRTALYAFLIAFFWLVLGGIALISPVPRALDIAWQFFAAWMVIFFLIVGVAGALLTVAALNGVFPPARRGPRTVASAPSPGTTMWAPPPATPPTRSGVRRQG